jgi:hypothetical protein
MHVTIANLLSRNPLGNNAYIDVLRHDFLRCKDVRFKATLAMSYFMLSFKEMATKISKGASRAPTNETCSDPKCNNELIV